MTNVTKLCIFNIEELDVMDVEPLELVPEEKWPQLLPSLKLYWPQSVLLINLLETLEQFPDLRRKFEFKIYCPYGDVTVGILTTCLKKSLYEVIIHCNHDLKTLLKAIKGSKLINWEFVVVQFTDRHVMECVARTMVRRNIEWYHLLSCDTIYLDRNLFEDVQIPQNMTFGLLSLKHVTQVDSTWEHRYPGSKWYLEQLIISKLGYGLFEKESNKLVAWVFYTESGTFDNLYVLEEYRSKGFGILLTKIAYNLIRKDKEYLYTFCVKGNSVALSMFQKLGIKVIGETFWAIFKSEIRSKI